MCFKKPLAAEVAWLPGADLRVLLAGLGLLDADRGQAQGSARCAAELT